MRILWQKTRPEYGRPLFVRFLRLERQKAVRIGFGLFHGFLEIAW